MFIVEDGTGFSNSNALASVEFVDNYHAERGNVAWANLELEKKQQLIIKATDYFVGIYAAVLLGVPLFSNQALPYPRTVNRVNVGNPVGIQQAIAELALVANTMSLTPSLTRGKKSVKVGPISVEYDGNGMAQAKFVAASLKVAPFLKSTANGMTARLIRT